MITRLPPLSPILLAATVLSGGLLLAACTSDGSPDSASTDSTAATTQTVSQQPPPPDPSELTEAEKNDERSVARKLSDASIEAKVKRALIRESSLRVFPFRPNAVNGHLVLRGDVNTPDQYRRAERIAGQIGGVTAVTNRLTMGGRAVTEARLAAADENPPSEEESKAVYHTVRQGDTLWDIARQYGASIQQIKNFNDLRSNNLRPGQRIRVR